MVKTTNQYRLGLSLKGCSEEVLGLFEDKLDVHPRNRKWLVACV